jgi:hypothetical protein
MKIVNFRVTDDEHKLMGLIARAAGLTLTQYVKQHFAIRAMELRLVEDPLAHLRSEVKQAQAPADKPKFKRLPIPNQGNVWNELIVLQLEQGKTHADIAEIYGTDVANIKAREKRGLEMREDAPEHIAQLLDNYYIELAESGQLEPDASLDN